MLDSAAVDLPIGAAFEVPPEVAPGVLAFVRPVADMLVIPMVIATNPGHGDVGRWLDSLPTTQTVIFVEVLSQRLAGMLERRGYVAAKMATPDDPDIDVWMRAGA